MKETIKSYLDGFALYDECFKAKYDTEMLDKCIDFIYSKAKELAKDKEYIAIEDDTVFKWARDYFNDGIANKEKEEKSPKGCRSQSSYGKNSMLNKKNAKHAGPKKRKNGNKKNS